MKLGLGLGLNYSQNRASSSYIYLLDVFPNAAYAYSFRLLKSDYVGKCCRVIRSSDNNELDIPFEGNYVKYSDIISFVGANNGYAVSWYDQSGNTVNKIQATASDQPIMVNAGSIELYNGFVTMMTSSVIRDGGLYNTVTGGGATSQCYNVMAIDPLEECLPAVNTHTSASRFYAVMQPNGSDPTLSSGTPTYYKNGVPFISPTRQTLYDAFNNKFAVLTTENVDLSSWTESSSMHPSYRGIRGHNFEEIVYYNSNYDQSLIVANQMSYYKIT